MIVKVQDVNRAYAWRLWKFESGCEDFAAEGSGKGWWKGVWWITVTKRGPQISRGFR